MAYPLESGQGSNRREQNRTVSNRNTYLPVGLMTNIDVSGIGYLI